jgi:hypothetical protein
MLPMIPRASHTVGLKCEMTPSSDSETDVAQTLAAL